MDDQKLIDCVRRNTVLYDLSDAKYMDIQFKNSIWNEIGWQMKTDGSLCKARWNNIRDTYRKSLKKTVTRSGKSVKKVYKYSGELNFLKKYFDVPEIGSNIGHDIQEVGERQRDNEENLQIDRQEPIMIIPEEDAQSERSQHLFLSNEDSNLEVPAESIRRKLFVKKSVPQSVAMDYIIGKNENALQQHPVDAFLGGIAPTLKTFSPYNLHFAKSEIFKIVQKYEFKTIMKQHSGTCDLNSMTSRSVHSPISSSSVSTPLPSPGEPKFIKTDRHQTSTSEFPM